MVNIMKLAFATLGFLAVSFVVKNFVLKQEFDIVSSIVDLMIVIGSLFVGGIIVSKVLKKDAKLINL